MNTKKLLFTAIACSLAIGTTAALANDIQECSSEDERLFVAFGSDIRSDDDEAMCLRSGGSIEDFRGVQFCGHDSNHSMCRAEFGEDYSYFYKGNCCVYDPPVLFQF